MATIDLREDYITPLYLETMRQRARNWSDELVEEQLQLFRSSIPDYPEVLELLEGELYRRRLNRLHRKLRQASTAEIEKLFANRRIEGDERELIQAELEIRRGHHRLTDSAAGRSAEAEICG